MQKYDSGDKSSLQRRCYQFSLDTIKLIDSLPNKRSSWVMGDQLIRSATSIGANIVEARASSSRLEFKKFYEVALKSANETKYWLGLLTDSGIINSDSTKQLLSEVSELANMLGSGVLKLKQKKF